MNTKEVCKQLSVTPKMLRVYESLNLIRIERGENNYRNYSIDDILQIQIICYVLHFNGVFRLFTGLLYTTFQRHTHNHDITTRRTAAI